jgi:demethylmenaquinone methyltransferase/2-methoxy-6-polyprenyl-1,4-benzoquinol methylase
MSDPYQKLAGVYDRFVEPVNRGVRRYVFRLFPPESGKRVLEVGCGTGTNLMFYRQKENVLCGLDLSPAMLKQARAKLENTAFLQQGDALHMPYRDGTFDVVLAMLTLHEMPERIREGVMAEMVRVTKKGGRLLVTDYRAGHLRFPRGWLYRLIILFFEIAAGREHFRNYRSFLRHKGLPELLRKQPVRIEREKIIAAGNLHILALRKG